MRCNGLLIGSVLLGLIAAPLEAQGFNIFEHGSCQMGRAGTGMAAPCDDASAVFFNPAAIAGTSGLTITAGGILIDVSGGFTDDLTQTRTALQNDIIPVPYVYATLGLSDNLGAGLGLFVPYGLGTEWPETFEGRFSGYDNSLQSIYIQPTLAYRLSDRLSIGGGLDVVIGSVTLKQHLDLSEFQVPGAGILFGTIGIPFHTAFANAELTADGATGYGGHVAVLLELSDRLSIAARYMSRVTLDYDGTAEFTQIDTGILLSAGNPFGVPAGTPLDVLIATAFLADSVLSNQTGSTSITMPDQLVAGLSFEASRRLMLHADYQFTNWSLHDRVELVFGNPLTPNKTLVENYEDTHAFRVGFDYDVSDGLTFRGGYLYHPPAAPDEVVTAVLPEATRNEATVGLGIDLGRSLRVDAAYQAIWQEDRRGRVREPFLIDNPTTDLNSGVYDFFGQLMGVTLTLKL
ncbi:MAG: OmpP1/FadL family transporter [Gemmatimonadales bacterium]